MSGSPSTEASLVEQLARIGVVRDDLLVVHTAFSKIGPVDGGPAALIAALQAAVGDEGTLVMPSMSDDDEQPFDPRRTPCRGMGTVADSFWRLPGVLRSNNPHAFAARGPLAREITADHSLDVPHGLDSPVGRVYERKGRILLIGVGHDANTTIHLAENLAGVRYLLPKRVTVFRDGRPRRHDYFEVDHCCERFALMDGWLDARDVQRRGAVGHARVRLMAARDVVDAALERLRVDETVFLHPPGTDDECDAARASYAQRVAPRKS
jgi:aminoglycoside 3-N-acetyltransferase